MARKQARHGQPAVYNSTPPTLTDGDDSALNVDASGNLKTTNGDIAGAAAPTTTSVVGGVYKTTQPTYTDGQASQFQTDANGNQRVTLASLIAGEDLTANVMKTEQRFSGTVVTADTQVKSGAGFLHSLTFAPNDSAPTAGSIIVYDNTAESGTQLFNVTFTTTWFVPFTVILDVTFATGLFIGFTTTNDVNVTPSYR